MNIGVINVHKRYFLKYSLPIEEIFHSYRVAQISFKMGLKLGLNQTQLSDVFTASLFHDIGKAMINKDILGKQGKLTLEERKQIEFHPIYSGNYVNNIEEIKNLSRIVRAHHERWDGKGYPDGLRGEKIPLLARIISVADVYDALKHPRVYRPYGFSDEEIKNIMVQGSGKQFDPEILKIFLKIVYKIAYI